MNRREQTHLTRAVEVSKQGSCRQKHGVVIAKGPRVMAVAVNTDRNDPNNCTHPKLEGSYHAEVNALKQLRGHDLSDAVLYSARTNRMGTRMNAKPCIYCQEAIRLSGIKKVIYT